MSEINNNISNFGHIDKIKPTKNSSNTKTEISAKDNQQEPNNYVKDTGVLGRSQIKSSKADVSESIDNAVKLAKTNPALLEGCETMFDVFYQQNLERGMNLAEAYYSALMQEEEFFNLAKAHIDG